MSHLHMVPATAEPLRSAAWIAAEVFAGERDAAWIMRQARRTDDFRIPSVQLSPRRRAFYESSVRRWLKDQEGA